MSERISAIYPGTRVTRASKREACLILRRVTWAGTVASTRGYQHGPIAWFHHEGVKQEAEIVLAVAAVASWWAPFVTWTGASPPPEAALGRPVLFVGGVTSDFRGIKARLREEARALGVRARIWAQYIYVPVSAGACLFLARELLARRAGNLPAYTESVLQGLAWQYGHDFPDAVESRIWRDLTHVLSPRAD